MNITLEQIEAKQTELADLIAKLKVQPKPIQYGIPVAVISLAPGERYAGIVLKDDGEPSHHLVLLPGEAEEVEWQEAKDWAEKQGGELPTRREQALLYANLKSEFKSAWYWSNEANGDASAWYQSFDNGNQTYDRQYDELRARAVRRLSI
jgi:hypothetical protein